LGYRNNKGPNNTSFGSGLGGVLHLFARNIGKKIFCKIGDDFGSYGLVKQSLGAGYEHNSNLFRIIRICKVMALGRDLDRVS
jgi:iron complex outermembrane receptor protein